MEPCYYCATMNRESQPAWTVTYWLVQRGRETLTTRTLCPEHMLYVKRNYHVKHAVPLSGNSAAR